MIISTPKSRAKQTSTPATKKASVANRRARAVADKAKPTRNTADGKNTAPARRGSKAAKILGLLKRPSGVTLKELVKATGWQPHSVRGFLSGTIGKKMATPVESFKSTAGERAYRISPK